MSKALTRALNHKNQNGKPTNEGIYLSNDQLIHLGDTLKHQADGPDGIWFRVGRITPISPYHTVELIPYKNGVGQSKIEIHSSGKLQINVGKTETKEGQDFRIDNNEDIIPQVQAQVVAFAATIGSQRTPPPFPE